MVDIYTDYDQHMCSATQRSVSDMLCGSSKS